MKGRKEELLHRFHSILGMTASSRVKISMLEALALQLRSHLTEKCKEGVETCESEMPMETPFEAEIEELEEKIMRKRTIKFELNEELECAEDELYEIEKVTETKRLCDDKMRREIDKKMLMVEWAQQRHQQAKPTPDKKAKNKTLGHISMKLKNIFG